MVSQEINNANSDPLISEVCVRRIDNKIYIFDAIDDKTQFLVLKHLDAIVDELKARYDKTTRLIGVVPEVIEIHINSPGGDVFSSFSIYDYLRNCPVQTVGIVDGRAFSGASIILCGCTYRVMSDNGFIMCHQPRTGVVGTADNILDTAENVKEVYEKMKTIYLNETKIPKEILDDLLKKDIYLDSKKCLEYGLIDEIQGKQIKRFEEKPKKKKPTKKKPIKEKEVKNIKIEELTKDSLDKQLGYTINPVDVDELKNDIENQTNNQIKPLPEESQTEEKETKE